MAEPTRQRYAQFVQMESNWLERCSLVLLAASCNAAPGANTPAKPRVAATEQIVQPADAATPTTERDAASLDAATAAERASTFGPLTPVALASLLDQAQSLDAVPAMLPEGVLRNFVLKHGVHRTGERGHLSEKRVSQSANPDAPRAILWDEGSGMVLTYNGGRADQTHPHRLDWHVQDPHTKALSLQSLDFAPQKGTVKGAANGADCASCHGPHERPIFSMYPDWPAFYGSDNDELTNPKVATQVAELRDYEAFVAGPATKHPRYAPLFEPARVQRIAHVPIYPTWPYRQNLDVNITAASRAFAFRPGLRLGVLLNRMQAQMLAAHIRAHENYAAYAPLFVHQLLQCSSTPASAKEHAQTVSKALTHKDQTLKTAALHADLVHYRSLWAIWDMTVADLDIRYAYGNGAYDNEDASAAPMQVGYIGRYWNSYFDGASTIDELVAFLLLQDLDAPAVKALGIGQSANSLTRKYGSIAPRMVFDKPFFDAMDTRAKWVPIPYPALLGTVHHRQGFPADFKKLHAEVCAALEPTLATRATP